MAAYLIFLRETPVEDEAALKAYHEGNKNVPIPEDLKVLVKYGHLEALEGEAPDGVYVMEFKDAQSARDFYNCPEYFENAKNRQKAAKYRCVLVDGA